ncbi:MAG: hypothetical protein A2W22_05665 [Candidatus Levybacteria bacterium RBG_16_35_11]|nr:MAG: hypothetical protein A2W22_05665 [Candidatus Levybacteria bacterium RBG_16_35_11]
MRFTLKFFISAFLIGILFLFLVSKPSNAQSTNPYSSPNTNPDVPRNLHTYAQSVVLEVLAAFSCQLTGVDPLGPNSKCLGFDVKTRKIGYVESNGGALGGMGSLIGMTYNIPVHTSDYTSYLASNFGLVKKSYAQSPGYTGLQPLVNVWKIFRDFTYLLFVFIFIVIGLAIMLRVKIDPRTVMTIQNQIPKIIIGLVLVTLSFAIAGLLIDFMWIVTYLIIGIFSQVVGANGAPIIGSTAVSGLANNPIIYFHDVGLTLFGTIWNASGEIGNIVSNLVLQALDSVIPNLDVKWYYWIFPPVGASMTLVNHLGEGLSKTLGGIVTFVSFIIIPIVLFVALFRLWFTLLQSFVMILINVIFSPIWILAGLIPNKQTGFGGWLKSMLANLSVFPVVVLMFVLARVFDTLIGESSQQFVPPLVGSNNSIDGLRAMLAIGIILLTPNVVNMTKAAFKSPKFDFSSLGGVVGAGVAVPVNTIKNIGSTIAGSREYRIKNFEEGQVKYGKVGSARSFFTRMLR